MKKMAKSHRSSGDRRRGEILDAMVHVAVSQGGVGLSMRGWASAVGLSAPTLIHHFGRRDEMISAVHHHFLAQEKARFLRVTEAATSLPQALWGLWEEHRAPAFAPRLRAWQELQGQWLNGGPETIRKTHQRLWEQWGEAMVALDGWPSRDAGRLVRVLVAFYRGLILDVLASDGDEGAEEALEEMLFWYQAKAASRRR